MTELDPGTLLAEHAHVSGCSFAESCTRFPTLAAAWNRGEMVSNPASSRQEPLLPQRRHYGELTTAEQRRHLPSIGRRLASAAQMVEGRTYLAKMGDPDCGGGIFEVDA